jgi:hypothetical protein
LHYQGREELRAQPCNIDHIPTGSPNSNHTIFPFGVLLLPHRSASKLTNCNPRPPSSVASALRWRGWA